MASPATCWPEFVAADVPAALAGRVGGGQVMTTKRWKWHAGHEQAEQAEQQEESASKSKKAK
jgi:hypothetical protein